MHMCVINSLIHYCSRTEIKFGAAGVGKMHLKHFPMNNPPEQCFSTELADNPIKDMFSSLEEDCFLFQNDKELIEKASKDDVHSLTWFISKWTGLKIFFTILNDVHGLRNSPSIQRTSC